VIAKGEADTDANMSSFIAKKCAVTQMKDTAAVSSMVDFFHLSEGTKVHSTVARHRL
jgi:hypothetical protein